MHITVIDTPDRLLEQFLFAHRIRFMRQYRYDGINHWVYPLTGRTLEVVGEYLSIASEKGGM